MKLGKYNILCLLSLICGGIFGAPTAAHAKYNPEDLTQMSAAMFWAKVNDLNLEKKDKEYIICGTDVCDPQKERCTVKRDVRYDRFTQQYGLLAIAIRGIGAGTVATFEYKCVPLNEDLPEGFNDAPEGGWVVRRKVRVSRFFGSTVKDKGICSTGSDGGAYCLAAKDGLATVKYNKAETAFRGCEVLPVKLFNGRKCFFCPLFAVVYKVAGEMTTISFKGLAAAFAVTLVLGWAIWIAVQTLTHVSSLTKQDAPKFLTGLIKQSYKVLIAFLLLQYSSQIFKYAVVPVLSAGLEFGNALLDERYSAIEVQKNQNALTEMEERNPGILKRLSLLTSTDYYTGDLYLKLDNFVVNLQRNITFMQGVGSSMICIGSNALVSWKSQLSFGDGFVIVIQGVLLAGFGFLLAIAFGFYLVDAVVQMGIAGALMPFLIASWPFKITSKYASTGWNMILNSAFVFLFAGMVLSVNLNLVDAALKFTVSSEQEEKLEKDKNLKEYDAKEVNMGGLYKIAQAINTQHETKLAELTDISFLGFLILVFCCIFGFTFLGRASELAGKFASGALKPIAPSIATMGGSAAKSMALKTTQKTREAIGKRVDKAVGGLITAPYRLAKAGINKLRGKDGSSGGSGGGGGKGGSSGGTGGGGGSGGGSGGSGSGGKGSNASSVAPKLNEGKGDAASTKPKLNEGGGSSAASVAPKLNEGNSGNGSAGGSGGAAGAAPKLSEGSGAAQNTQSSSEKVQGKGSNRDRKKQLEQARRSATRKAGNNKPKKSSGKSRNKHYKGKRKLRRK